MEKNRIATKILRAFLLLCIASLAASGAVMLINMMNIRDLSIESGSNIGSAAADNGRDSLMNLTFQDIAELMQAKSDNISLQVDAMREAVLLLKGYAEHLYNNNEKFRPVKIPSMRQVPTGELKMYWFLEPEIINDKTYTEADLVRSGLLEETWLLGNMESVAELVKKSIPDILTVFITTKSGQNIQYDRDASIKFFVPESKRRLHERPWYTTARDSYGLYMSEAYLDLMAERGLTISISSPWYSEDGEFLGVLGIDVRIDDMYRAVEETVIRENGYAVLINNYAGEGSNESRIVSAPGLNDQNKNNPAAFLGGGADGIIAGMRTLPAGRGSSFLGAGKEEKKIYIIWTPVRLTDWQLAYVVPEKDILAPAAELGREITRMTGTAVKRMNGIISTAILVSLLLLAAIVLLASWTSRLVAGKIARPIASLTSGVRKAGEGNLDYRSEIKTGDEIEDLSLAFERMTVELKNHIENLRLVTAEKERIGAELNVAAKIQASMLPGIFPPFPHRREFDIYGSMLPAREVGGDFFNFFFIDENTLAVLIADVSGKGVPAALFMVIAMTLIENSVHYGMSPGEAFKSVNNLLCRNNDEDMFVTAFMGYLDIPRGKFTCVNAGHNPPVIKRGDDFEWLKIKHGLVLGGMEGMAYTEEETLLMPGDMIYLYTDGVTEAADPEKNLFGEDRLMETIRDHRETGVQGFICSIKQGIDIFAAGAEQADDITMLVLKYYGPNSVSKLDVGALLENLETVQNFVTKELEKRRCSARIQSQICIAVEEIFVNIANYAYHPEIGVAVLRVTLSGDEICFEFEDEGKPYNPLEKADPDITAAAEERPIGGLGIFMVKKIMDFAEYRHEDGKNLLILKKIIL
ncbi:MAG: SpoIIE family protein phosphatase [Treponema sp.]|jgi:sigma-B regulation protein RsbU (phosphoserine phosphatase)|nr:SpoIIE family protein phosphatase [Treponema sp.]